MDEIRMILFDIDGVITDGKKYMYGNKMEIKSISLKDLDALHLLKKAGYLLGCVTGEDTDFCRQFDQMEILDYVKLGCKNKSEALKEIGNNFDINANEICYIGDGKYDIPILKEVGLAICPSDSIDEVKKLSNIVLKRKGGEGCIAEIYTLLVREKKESTENKEYSINVVFEERIEEHFKVLSELSKNSSLLENCEVAVGRIVECLQGRGQVFLCGNGGSAADAQHLAAELVGRFYLERKAFSAEALTTNVSILTALANDYDYNMIFARQLEAKAEAGDVLIGITTSGTSENIIQAFQKAKEMQVNTILMTGDVSKYLPVLEYTDCLLAVPSLNTPRIQEMHILLGHIICEIVEKELTIRDKQEEKR